MIAVDSSAVLAVALDELDADRFAGPLAGARCLVGWPTLLEIQLVLSGQGKKRALQITELWRVRDNVTAVPFDEMTYLAASQAFDRFGKGVGHPAKLNFGDCMAYAVAKHFDVPLLFKGTDFAKTDVRAALQ
jgi:ribonuclease VapC